MRYSPSKVIFIKRDIRRVYTSLANFYSVQTKLFIGQPRMSLLHFDHILPTFLMNGPVDELVGAAEEVVMFSTLFLTLMVLRRHTMM